MIRRSAFVPIALAVAVLVVLHVISLRNYLLFHSLAELFSVVIAFSIFIIAWNSRSLMENSYMLFLGIAYLFVGTFDLLHTLSYAGMGVFSGSTTNLPTQLWIAARYTESLSLLIGPVFLGRRLRADLVFAAYTVAAVLILSSIFYWHTFPVCFVEGRGLTPFKIVSEYAISGILLGAIAALRRRRAYLHPRVLRLLIASIAVTIVSELCFTHYINVYGFANFIGHYFKIVSFYLIYKALVETGLRQPYDLLFREIRQREEAFRESEAKFRALAENSPTIIASLDRDLRFIYANPAMRSLTGGPPSHLLGKTGAQANLPTQLSNLLAWIASTVCRSARVEIVETEISTSGSGKFYRITAVPEVSSGSEVRQILIVASDITELKKAQEITQRDKEALERMVSERSRELLEAQIQLEEAKRLSAIGTLAATVAHELRNPLGVIQTALYNIRRKNKDDALDRHLARMEKKVLESNLIISNLLRYSRVKQLSYEEANLPTIIRDSLEAAADRFPGQVVDIVLDLEPIGNETLKLDTVQMREVFDNIINNAYQAVGNEGGRIEIVGRIDKEGTVSVSIKDNGSGITREDLEHVFEPFFSRKSKGTGLGLSICKEIIRLHGGTILVESEPACGTTVTVVLPTAPPKP
jgi:PAS domain S-box-containing protein